MYVLKSNSMLYFWFCLNVFLLSGYCNNCIKGNHEFSQVPRDFLCSTGISPNDRYYWYNLLDSVGTPSKHNDFRTIKLARIAAINRDNCQTEFLIDTQSLHPSKMNITHISFLPCANVRSTRGQIYTCLCSTHLIGTLTSLNKYNQINYILFGGIFAKINTT